MRLLIKPYKCDKNYFIAAIITAVCAIISGIVLYIFANINIYFKNFADRYVFFIFCFDNVSLIFPHILSELLYLYLFFMAGYFCKFKFLSLIIVFVRCIFFAVYMAILIELSAFGGIAVALIVFFPVSVCSLFLCCFVTDACKNFSKRLVFFIPAILAVFNTLILLLLVNIVFRVIIVIA